MKKQKKTSSRPCSVWMSIFITLIIGVFVLLGMHPLFEMVALAAPTKEVPVKLVDRDLVETWGASTRFYTSKQLSHRVTVEFEDGSTRQLACDKELFAAARGAGRNLAELKLKMSVFGDRPRALIMTTKSLVSVPMLGVEGKTKTTEYRLAWTNAALVIGLFFCWSIVGWFVWRLPCLEGFQWSVFVIGMAVIVVLSYRWWVGSV
ncbi:hypothetical protein FEM03_20775 [Phragmitibacter flavus]|uniref:Uncharacterized protein n=1 Tax=Phragmitibacter flavus TaxID=2576071 RepID=A0A5R8K907_9BACT|nr:hypothetical protein [Phragmitibacter flavus]TLD68771.1 hypothetical protein FEM03_20775 [Phragmitibacter flavus]